MNGGFMDVDMANVILPYKQRVAAIAKEDWTLIARLDEITGDVTFRVTCVSGKEVAYFILLQLPGCCGVALSTGAIVFGPHRNKGLGTILNELRKDISREAGYTVLMCTDVMHNEPQRKILQKNGWKDVFEFVNRRTGNQVAISVVEL